MRTIKCIFFKYYLLATVIIITNLKAQDSQLVFVYPSAREVTVSIKADVFQLEEKFVYEYRLMSLPESKQKIWTFDVEYKGKLEDLTSPDGWIALSGRGVNRISWGASDSLSFLQPGNTLEGFSFKTTTLPTIRNYYVRGWVPIPIVETEPDSIIGSSIYENSKKGVTLSPKAPADSLIPIVFIDTLISYKHQAFDLGWIDNEGILNSLDQKLQHAKDQLDKGKTKQAVNQLNAFLNEVEAQNGKHITEEAYALLKYNTEYLIERLEE